MTLRQVDRRIAALQASSEPQGIRHGDLEHGHTAGYGCRDERHLVPVQRRRDRTQARFEARIVGRIVGLHEAVERGQQAHDLLLAGLEAAADAMVRHAAQVGAIDHPGRRPGLGRHVHVDLLQQRRGDKIAAAGEDAGGLRPAQRLAAGEGHQIGAHRGEALEVLPGRPLRGGVDDQRHAIGAADRGDGWQIDETCGIGREGDRHYRGRQRAFDLPGFQAAHAGAGAAVVVPDIDQPRAGRGERVGIAGAMGARDQDIVGERIGVRQRRHLGHVPARDRRGGGKRQRGSSAGRHNPRLGSGRLGDARARGILQLADIDRCPRSGGHGLDDFRRHDRAAKSRQRAGGVDAATNTQTLVWIGDHPSSLSQHAQNAIDGRAFV